MYPTADTFIDAGAKEHKANLARDPTQPGAPCSGMEELHGGWGFSACQRATHLSTSNAKANARPDRLCSWPPPAPVARPSPRANSAHGHRSGTTDTPLKPSWPLIRPCRARRRRIPRRSQRRPCVHASHVRGGRAGSEIITEELTDYHQSLPGERKSVSRSNSRRGRYKGPPPGTSLGHSYNAG
ncbi:hypothetical protein C8R47DRAFT_1216024 [Mycena vitilis]|nr:hypothetical protein C8R47DRAFT_1216024 [Mycena vitilis]